MQKPRGTITIDNVEMQDCLTLEDITALFLAKGVPLLSTKRGWLVPDPDYTYTERVDYARHAITITWELNHE
tara:strand:+ start:125 stop:340 length:216 start_codon:yes stop_codon:yes gene_type:complete